MATIRPSALPTVANANASAAFIQDDGSSVVQVTPVQIVDAGAPLASEAEAEAGTNNSKRMSPLRTAQAILFQTSALSSGLAAVTGALAGKQDTISMTTNRLLGRYSAGTGGIEEITLGPNLSLSGSGVLDATGGGSGGTTAAFVTPQQYGAVGDGTTDDRTAILNAIQSGNIVDGGGKTYAISAPMTPSSIVGLRNCQFKWSSTGAMSAQQYFLNLVDKSNYFLRGNVFDLGTVTDTGNTGDSSRGAVRVTTSNPNVTFNTGVIIEDNRCFGGGNGTAFNIRSCEDPLISGNTVHDRDVTVPSGHSQDCQNGFDTSQNRRIRFVKNVVKNLRSRETSSGTYVFKWSRGFLFTENNRGSVVGNEAYGCDQNFDFSGAIGGASTNGNTGLSITSNTSDYCRTWAYKFANCIRDSVFTGNVGTRFGFGGCTVSGQSSAWSPNTPTLATRNLLIANNMFYDPSDLDGRTDIIGIWINTDYKPEYPGYPEGVRVLNNTIEDRTGGGRLKYGIAFINDDRLVVANAAYNECRGNRVRGAVTAATIGCYPNGICSLSGTNSQTIANDTATDLLWDSEVVDGENMHSNTTNPARITATREGWYKVSVSVVMTASATGYRSGRILRNGGTFPGCELSETPISSTDTVLNGTCLVYLTVGQHLRVEVRQTSGSNLNAQLNRSQFTAERVEM